MSLHLLAQLSGTPGNLSDRFTEIGVAIRVEGQIEVGESMLDPLIAERLAGLPFKGADLAGDFLDNIRDPGEVGVDQRKLVQRFLTLSLVESDASCFFENCPSLSGIRRQDLVDLPLQHEGIRNTPHPGVGEKALNIFETRDFAIDVIITATVA